MKENVFGDFEVKKYVTKPVEVFVLKSKVDEESVLTALFLNNKGQGTGDLIGVVKNYTHSRWSSGDKEMKIDNILIITNENVNEILGGEHGSILSFVVVQQLNIPVEERYTADNIDFTDPRLQIQMLFEDMFFGVEFGMNGSIKNISTEEEFLERYSIIDYSDPQTITGV